MKMSSVEIHYDEETGFYHLNDTKPEDHAGPFVDINGSYFCVGLDHCWNPEADYGVATKATAIMLNGGLTIQYPKK